MSGITFDKVILDKADIYVFKTKVQNWYFLITDLLTF